MSRDSVSPRANPHRHPLLFGSTCLLSGCGWGAMTRRSSRPRRCATTCEEVTKNYGKEYAAKYARKKAREEAEVVTPRGVPIGATRTRHFSRRLNIPRSVLLFSEVPHEVTPEARFHPDRAVGGHRHHRRADRPALARRAGGPRGRPPRPVRQQPEADRPRACTTTTRPTVPSRWGSPRPPRATPPAGITAGLWAGFSAHAQLLPYMEQTPLYNATNFSWACFDRPQ